MFARTHGFAAERAPKEWGPQPVGSGLRTGMCWSKQRQIASIPELIRITYIRLSRKLLLGKK